MMRAKCEICGDDKSQLMNWQQTGWRCDRHPFYKLALVAALRALTEEPQ